VEEKGTDSKEATALAYRHIESHPAKKPIGTKITFWKAGSRRGVIDGWPMGL
jgi:hypothetical protein